jgi:hypothetical protein
MRNVYRVLAFVLAAEVLIQAMAIAYALAGLGKWVEDDGGMLNKQVLDSEPDFQGTGGFATHFINGTLIIPIVVLLLLIVSFFAKVPGAIRNAAILFGMVALQIFLGIFSHVVPFVVVLHVLNGFGILAMAITAGRSTFAAQETREPAVAV